MNETFCHQFYEYVLLPQFGMEDGGFNWKRCEVVGPDEKVHYFTFKEIDFALIYEDYDGLGRTSKFIEDNVKLVHSHFEYIQPTSKSDVAPSYPVKFPAPSKFADSITGMFTLVRI